MSKGSDARTKVFFSPGAESCEQGALAGTSSKDCSETLNTNFQVERILINPFSNIPCSQLIHIPFCPHKPPVQELRLGRSRPDGEVTGKVYCKKLSGAFPRTLGGSVRTVIPWEDILGVPVILGSLRKVRAWVEAQDLYFLRRGVFGNLLQQQGPRILAQSISRLRGSRIPVMDGKGGDMNDMLWLLVSMLPT